MTHPFPKGIAVSYCQACARIWRLASWVNRENEPRPLRFCARCGGPLAVAQYVYERPIDEPREKTE